MRNNSDHAMFADANHDEQSAQSFIKTLRVFSMRNFFRGNETILNEKVLSKRTDGSCPPRREMREALENEPHNKWWSSMMRTTQEMLYDTVGPSIERQLPDLVERAKSLRGKLGSLTLDDSVEVPPYLSAVDMHCKPGSYQQEMIADDVFAGAEFDRTFRLYSMGGLGPNLDDMGFTLAAWMRQQFGDIGPKRVLDMGCTVGHSTLPYCDLFPDAEIHAIDVAATCLRYGHARAVAMDKEVHFSQQNAEHTNFEDGSFDLVVSHAILHETSRRAIRAIFKECYRLLAPGGLMIHLDGITPDKPLDKYYSDWMSINNNEPYLGTVQDEDFVGICTQAGFDADKVTLGDAESQFVGKASDDKPVYGYLAISAQK
ncbi:MAG: methyltransferase domain-containing protein [Alphaproteobacteria bacterium]|nr:methyltransferase domain-containing protein [Alphaproteobacteria bacterium]